MDPQAMVRGLHPCEPGRIAPRTSDFNTVNPLSKGTFAVNNPQSQIDFGYRAVHLSTVYSKKIIDLYYGKKPELAYWFGCSSGGKQGLKEVGVSRIRACRIPDLTWSLLQLQMYPEDYDAALVGE